MPADHLRASLELQHEPPLHGGRAITINHAGRELVQVNVAPFDADKHGAAAVVCDASSVIEALGQRLQCWRVP